jgi:ketopantoate reductase
MGTKYNNETFVKKVEKKYGNMFEFLEEYISSRTLIKTKCKNGHVFLGDPKKFTKKNGYVGCPVCDAESKEQYDLNPNVCINCGNKIEYKINASVTRKKKFCSNSCSAIYNNKNRKIVLNNKCLNCGKKLSTKKGKYCSKECQAEYQYNSYIKRWKQNLETGLSGKYGLNNYIKKYIFNKYNNKCARCGWDIMNVYTHKVPLEIEHIDGNFLNNGEDNLILLCPNCHSLTSTYKGANMGKGRKSRNKYR